MYEFVLASATSSQSPFMLTLTHTPSWNMKTEKTNHDKNRCFPCSCCHKVAVAMMILLFLMLICGCWCCCCCCFHCDCRSGSENHTQDKALCHCEHANGYKTTHCYTRCCRWAQLWFFRQDFLKHSKFLYDFTEANSWFFALKPRNKKERQRLAKINFGLTAKAI